MSGMVCPFYNAKKFGGIPYSIGLKNRWLLEEPEKKKKKKYEIIT